MSLFANMTSTGLEETTDRLGGFQPLDSDIYTGKVKVAYAITSAGGARGIVVEMLLDNGKEFSTTQYITNKNGENYFLNKQDSSKKVPLPGFTIIDELCLCTTQKPLSEQDTEEKAVNIYDYDLKKAVPKHVPVLVDLLGTEVSLAIQRVTVDKNVKDSSGNYVPSGETRDENEVAKVFNTEARLTVPEARDGKTEPAFWNAWLERNKDKIFDKTSKDGGKTGKPVTKPVAGNSAPRTSLFAKK